jgi:hypothetical protein
VTRKPGTPWVSIARSHARNSSTVNSYRRQTSSRLITAVRTALTIQPEISPAPRPVPPATHSTRQHRHRAGRHPHPLASSNPVQPFGQLSSAIVVRQNKLSLRERVAPICVARICVWQSWTVRTCPTPICPTPKVGSVASGRTCRATAVLFGVSVASAVKWSQRWRASGSAGRLQLLDPSGEVHPRRAATELGQTYEPEVPVEVREWIAPASLPFSRRCARPSGWSMPRSRSPGRRPCRAQAAAMIIAAQIPPLISGSPHCRAPGAPAHPPFASPTICHDPLGSHQAGDPTLRPSSGLVALKFCCQGKARG